MSTPCSWNSHQETILLNVLKKAREAGLQSESGWKNTAFELVVEALSGTESESGGSRKNVSQVKSRWQKFKSEYTIVKKLRNASGFGWDSERGLVTASADVWDAYIAVHDKAKKFKKTPFPFYDDVAELVDGIIADGRGAFRPGRANQDIHAKAGTSTSISVDTDTTVSAFSAQAHVEVSESTSNASDSDVEDDEKAAKIPDKQSPDTSKIPVTPATKKGRQSGAAAIFALSESIETVANSFNATAQGASSQMPITSPQRKTAAIRAIEKDEELSDEEMVNVADLIRERTDIADTYLALTKQSTRSAYLKKQLDKFL